MNLLSKAEEMILLTIYRLEDDAYGVTIRQHILETADKDYTYGTLYGLLEQLVRKDYVVRVKGEPTPERGGRGKTYYRLTKIGVEALKHSQQMHQRVWHGINDLKFEA